MLPRRSPRNDTLRLAHSSRSSLRLRYFIPPRQLRLAAFFRLEVAPVSGRQITSLQYCQSDRSQAHPAGIARWYAIIVGVIQFLALKRAQAVSPFHRQSDPAPDLE